MFFTQKMCIFVTSYNTYETQIKHIYTRKEKINIKEPNKKQMNPKIETKFEKELKSNILQIVRKDRKKKQTANLFKDSDIVGNSIVGSIIFVDRQTVWRWKKTEGLPSNCTIGQAKTHKIFGEKINGYILPYFRQQTAYPVPTRSQIFRLWYKGEIAEISAEAIEEWYDADPSQITEK